MRGDVHPCRSWALLLLVAGPGACQHEREQAAPPPASATAPSPPAPTASPSVEAQLPSLRERAARAGELVSTPHFSMSFASSKECAMEPHFKPHEGFVTLGVEVTIQALGPLQVPANPFYATLIDASNVVYESTLAGCQPALVASQLSEGKRASGWISFDVPTQAKGLRLAYAPVLLGAGREELLFQLGR
jgi:uncharacterized protein DUF4352